MTGCPYKCRLIRTTGPVLLGYTLPFESDASEHAAWRDLPRHKDEDQVRLDVDRAFIYYPKSRDSKLEIVEEMKHLQC